jgi:hypothetical protein
MERRHGHVLWVLALGGLGLAGCSSKAASRKAEGLTKPLTEPAAQAHKIETKPVAKPAPRESVFSTYVNAQYGVSFRYPRNYPLDEGAPNQAPLAEQTGAESTENVAGVRSQVELESEQPGSVLVATIAVPDDSFPNTTFAGGSVQFAVNRYLPEGGCQDFPITRTGDAKAASGTVKVQGMTFTWADSDEGEGDTEFLERDYAGFANDTCYEFFVRVGVESADESDQLRPVNQKKIMGQLDKIVTSLQIEPKAVSVLDQRPAVKTDRGRR